MAFTPAFFLKKSALCDMMARLLKYYMPVCGLGLTQIIGYGTLLYSYAVLLPIMADELGLGPSDAFGLLSIGFFWVV